jgi:cell division protein FtsB
MTNSELEIVYNSLSKRQLKLERIINSAISVTQLNSVSLILESKITALETENETLKNRIAALEAHHAGA